MLQLRQASASILLNLSFVLRGHNPASCRPPHQKRCLDQSRHLTCVAFEGQVTWGRAVFSHKLLFLNLLTGISPCLGPEHQFCSEPAQRRSAFQRDPIGRAGALLKVNADGPFTVFVDGLNQPTSVEFTGNTAGRPKGSGRALTPSDRSLEMHRIILMVTASRSQSSCCACASAKGA